MDNLAEKKEAVYEDLKDVMLSAPQKEASQSKSKTPILNVSVDVQKKAEAVYNAKVKMEMDEREFEVLSAELVTEVAPMRKDLCQREYVSSVKVPTGTKHLVEVTFSGNFKKIPHSQERELVSIMGENEYKQNFFTKYEIIAEDKTEQELEQFFRMLSPNDGATEEDRAIGIARFKSFFKVKGTIRPYENFKRNFLFYPEDKRNKLELSGVVQYTPSIKTR